ncbi:MAG: hypothetical protein MUO31_14585 [Thermodesulfovibrionales bacterium]|nr:hypothetical protein [Thermodesulfovibrionales bacterium]
MPKIVIVNQPIPTGNIAVLETFFSTCIHLLFQHSPAHLNINCEIRIKFGTDGPRIQYDGNAAKGYDVDLTAENYDWCKSLYQFGHEACHILAQCQNSQPCNQWFEESLCEVTSLFSIKAIADMKTHGPCDNYTSGARPYCQCLNEYANQHINDPTRQYQNAKLDSWFMQNESVLRQDPYYRNLQWIAANKILPMFLSNSSNLAAIEFLNSNPCSKGNDSFLQYLTNWKTALPQQYHALIDEIIKLFF